MIARCILKLTGRHEATCVVRKGRVIGWRRAETRSETTGQELHACRARLWMVDLLLTLRQWWKSLGLLMSIERALVKLGYELWD